MFRFTGMLRSWQPLVWCCMLPRSYENVDFLGEYPGLFPHSALVGSTVDFSMVSVYVAREGELVSCGHLRCCLCLPTETGLHSANCAKAGDSTAQLFVGR